ncbi:MAG: hypothetical protein JRH20_26635 [Deltaproteobacteria bacterium]|nr:hypothetical protein [Deltaproteobacteria bacterium]
MRVSPAAILLPFVVLVGCENLDERAQYLTDPDVFQWSRHNFRIEGVKKMGGNVNLFGNRLSFHCRGFPPGTKIALGDKTATVSSEGKLHLKTNVQGLMGAVALGKLSKAKLTDVSVTIHPPGKKPLTVPLPAMRLSGIDDVLKKVKKGPVRFGAESTAGSGTIRNMIWVDWTLEHPVLGSKPATLSGIDAVLLVERLEGTTRMCTGYKTRKGQPMPDVKLRLRDTVASIYARRTGKLIAKKQFSAVNSCPTYVSKKRGIRAVRNSPLPKGNITDWAKSHLSS